jgi:hypothetical protein
VKKLLTAGFIAAAVMSFAPMGAAHADCVHVDTSTAGPSAGVNPGPCADDGNGADSVAAVGFTCGFASNDDPTGAIANPGTQVGEVDGGPVVVADLPWIDNADPDGDGIPDYADVDTNGNPASATITCALQVGGTGVYADPDAVSASASGAAVVYLPPTVISYQATATDPVWSCTTWTITDGNGASVTLYADDVTGNFSTDPTTAKCALATSQSENPCDIDPTAPGCTLPDAVKP